MQIGKGTLGRRASTLLAMPVIVVTAALSAQAKPPEPTQYVTHDEMAARRKQGKSLFETTWKFDKQGDLVQWPNPVAGGSSDRGMPFAFGSHQPEAGKDRLAIHLRAIDFGRELPRWLPPLLRRPGNLCASTNADYHLRKLGFDTSTVALRQFLLQPDESTEQRERRRTQLHRELAIRLLAQRGAKGARGELQSLARRSDDRFVRDAAQTALHELGLGEAPARTALAGLAIRPPSNATLWLFFDRQHFQARPDIATAVRTHLCNQMWDRLLDFRRDMSGYILAGAQYFVDMPDELPFAVADCWGRANIDQCLLALDRPKHGSRLLWAAASGRFEPHILSGHLTRQGVEHAFEDGVLTSDSWWQGYRATVAEDHVVLAHKDAVLVDGDKPRAATWPEVIKAATFAKAPLAYQVVDGAAWENAPWLPLDGAQVGTIGVQPLTISVRTDEDETSTNQSWERFCGSFDAQATSRLPDELRVRWNRAMATAAIGKRATGSGTRLDLEAQGLDFWQLWPLLLR